MFRGNAGGVPEPCTVEEARPIGTCGNPHGIQARPDLGRMVTNDYADARELGSDPLKTTHQDAFRPTSRIWDISNPSSPKLISVAHMPKSFKNTPNPAHDNIGIMEGAKTYAPAKGMFSGSMCGGGIFFLPDVTKVQHDSSASGSRSGTTAWPRSRCASVTSRAPRTQAPSPAPAPVAPGTR